MKWHRRVRETVTIPTRPRTVARLTVLLEEPTSEIGAIAAELAQDPPLTAKALRIANSSYYPQGEPVLVQDRRSQVARNERRIVISGFSTDYRVPKIRYQVGARLASM